MAATRVSSFSFKHVIGVWMNLFYVFVYCKATYSSQWAAHIHGGRNVAQQIADKHDFHIHAEIFPDVYHLEHKKVAKRSIEPSHHHHTRLIAEPVVKWAEQQKVRRRSKRDFVKRPRTVAVTRLKHASSMSKDRIYLNDPKWPQMWYLNRGHGLDMNVQGAWEEGITGKGIVVTILDDGLEKDHPDLIHNYDPLASYDVNSHDGDPMPRYDAVDSNRHGTRCAGEVAATANNSLCSVGIAYGAAVGGVRMLDGDVTDAVEARSLSLNPAHIDIYSASWGPDDDGKTVDGPGELATRAFIEGVTRGREGRGSIFIWASGNGGRDHDNCNCDGYTNSIWTLSISSATETGLVPWYSEACSSTLATTYSSGSSFEHQVVTTDLHHDCTNNHTGTSASAPLAAGICALALEANTALSWRDMQHIVVATARPANLDAPDWATNGVGRNVSHSFGYGLMDATAMVRLARKWKTVPEQFKCEVFADLAEKERHISPRSSIRLRLMVKECPNVNYLEHVQAKVTLTAHRRGDLKIILISPAGTRSTLLAERPNDSSKAGFNAWPFMSVHTWGEQPFGTWYLEIHNEGKYFGDTTDWSIVLHGTTTLPVTIDNKPIVQPPSLEKDVLVDKTVPQPIEDVESNHVSSSRGVGQLSDDMDAGSNTVDRQVSQRTAMNVVPAGGVAVSSLPHNTVGNGVPSSSEFLDGIKSSSGAASACQSVTSICLEAFCALTLWGRRRHFGTDNELSKNQGTSGRGNERTNMLLSAAYARHEGRPRGPYCDLVQKALQLRLKEAEL